MKAPVQLNVSALNGPLSGKCTCSVACIQYMTSR